MRLLHPNNFNPKISNKDIAAVRTKNLGFLSIKGSILIIIINVPIIKLG